MSRGIFGCHDLVGCYWHLWGEARGAAKHPSCTGLSHNSIVWQTGSAEFEEHCTKTSRRQALNGQRPGGDLS